MEEVQNLNHMELMRVIYREIIETKETVNEKNTEKIDNLSNKVNEMKEDIKKINDLTNMVNEMKKEIKKVDILTNTVNEMKKEIKKVDTLTNAVNEMKKDIKEIKLTLDKHTEKLEEHDKRFENLENKTDKIDKKLDNLDKIEKLHFEYTRNKFGRLDKKIDANFSCLENKIDNETEERKVDISRIEGVNDFDKIVLSDFGSRISILEEESEKYNVN